MSNRQNNQIKLEKYIPHFLRHITIKKAKKIRLIIQKKLFGNNPDASILTSKIISLSGEIIRKNNIHNIVVGNWWVSEKTQSPWIWWFIESKHSFFITRYFEIFQLIDSQHYFCRLFALKKRTLLEGDLISRYNNPKKWEFLVNDILFLKDEKCINWTVSYRLKKIKTDIIRPFRKQKNIIFPFEIKGKHSFKVNNKNINEMLKKFHYSVNFQSYIFTDYTKRIVRTQGLLFRSNHHNNIYPNNSLYVWKFTPTFVGNLQKPFHKKKQINIYLKSNSGDFHVAIQSEFSELRKELLNGISEYKRGVIIRYNVDLSQYEIISENLPHIEVWSIEATMNLMQKLIGVIGNSKLKDFLSTSDL